MSIIKRFFQGGKNSRLDGKMKSARREGLHMEPLEDRLLLTAIPNDWNSAAQVGGTFLGEYCDMTLSVGKQEGSVYVGIVTSTPDGSSLDPGKMVVLDSVTGQESANASIIQQSINYNGTTNSLVILKITPGALAEGEAEGTASQYTLRLYGEKGTAGDFICDVFIPGDTNSTNGIQQDEVNRVRNHVEYTAVYENGAATPFLINYYWNTYGVDITKWDSVYDARYDVNMDGRMTSSDLDMVSADLGLDLNSIQLIVDNIAPETEIMAGDNPLDALVIDEIDPLTDWIELWAEDAEGKIANTITISVTDEGGISSSEVKLVDLGTDGKSDGTIVEIPEGNLEWAKSADGKTWVGTLRFDGVALNPRSIYELTVTSNDLVKNEDVQTALFVAVQSVVPEGNPVVITPEQDGETENQISEATITETKNGGTPASQTIVFDDIPDVDWTDQGDGTSTAVVTLDSGARIQLTKNNGGDGFSKVEYLGRGEVLSAEDTVDVSIDSKLTDDSEFNTTFMIQGVDDPPEGAQDYTGEFDLPNGKIKLGAGETATLDLTAGVTDPNGATSFGAVLGAISCEGFDVPTADDLGAAVTDGVLSFDLDKIEAYFASLALNATAEITINYNVFDTAHPDNLSETATVTIKVIGQNEAPVAEDFDVTVNAGEAVDVDWQNYVSDVDAGDSMTLVSIYGTAVAVPLGGVQTIYITSGTFNKGKTDEASISGLAEGNLGFLTVAADGTVTYTATGDYLTWRLAEGDTFTFDIAYAVEDSTGVESNTAVCTTEVAGQFNELEILTSPDQTTFTGASADIDGWVALGQRVTFSSDKGEAYTFAATSITDEDGGEISLGLVDFYNVVNGQSGGVSLRVAKSILENLEAGDYEVEYSWTNGDGDTGTESFTLTVETITYTVEPISAGTMTEDGATPLETTVADELLPSEIIVDGIQASAYGEIGTTLRLAAVTGTGTPDIVEGSELWSAIAALGNISGSDGAFVFTAAPAIFQYLSAGDSLSIRFEYQIDGVVTTAGKFDGLTGSILVEVTGVSDAPVAEAVTQVISANTLQSSSNTVTFNIANAKYSDVDTGDTAALTGVSIGGVEYDLTALTFDAVEVKADYDGAGTELLVGVYTRTGDAATGYTLVYTLDSAYVDWLAANTATGTTKAVVNGSLQYQVTDSAGEESNFAAVSVNYITKNAPVVDDDLLDDLLADLDQEDPILEDDASFSINLGEISGLITNDGSDTQPAPESYTFTGVSCTGALLNGSDAAATYAGILEQIGKMAGISGTFDLGAVTGTGEFELLMADYAGTDGFDFNQLAAGDSLVLTFAFTVEDNTYGAEATGTFDLTIHGVNDAPTAEDFAVAVNADNEAAVDWAAHVSDIDAGAKLSLTELYGTTVTGAFQLIDVTSGIFNKGKADEETISGLTTEGLGFLTIAADGSVRFIAEGNYLIWRLAAGDTFTVEVPYTVADQNNESASAVCTVTVNGQFEALMLDEIPDQTVWNEEIPASDGWITLSGTDVEFAADKNTEYEFYVVSVEGVTLLEGQEWSDIIKFTVDQANGAATVSVLSSALRSGGVLAVDENTDFTVTFGYEQTAAGVGTDTVDDNTLKLTVKEKASAAAGLVQSTPALTEDITGTATVNATTGSLADVQADTGMVNSYSVEANSLSLTGATGAKAFADMTTSQIGSILAMATLDASGNFVFTNPTDGFFNWIPSTGSQTLEFTYNIASYNSTINGTATDFYSDKTGKIRVTIQGVNDAPTDANAYTGTIALSTGAVDFQTNGVTAGAALDLLANVVDPDTAPSALTASLASTSSAYANVFQIVDGVLSVRTGGLDLLREMPEFKALAAGAEGTLTLDYVVSDGVASLNKSVTVTVTGQNDAPTANNLVLTDEILASANHFDIPLISGGYAADVDGNLDTSRIQIKNSAGTFVELKYGDAAISVTGGSGTVTIEQVGGWYYLRYQFSADEIYTASTEDPISVALDFKAVDTLDAVSDAAKISFNITPDYEAPSFDGTIGNIEGSAAASLGDDEHFVTIDLDDYTEGTVVNCSVALNGTNTSQILDTTKGDGKGYVIDAANHTVTFYFIYGEMYHPTLDLSDIKMTATVDDGRGTSASQDFTVSLKERYTSTISLVATTAATPTETQNVTRNSSFSYASVIPTTNYVSLDGVTEYYLEIWLQDTSCLITDVETGLTNINFSLDYATGEGSSILSVVSDNGDEDVGFFCGGFVNDDFESYYDDDQQLISGLHFMWLNTAWETTSTSSSYKSFYLNENTALLLARLKVTVSGTGEAEIGIGTLTMDTSEVDKTDPSYHYPSGWDNGWAYSRFGYDVSSGGLHASQIDNSTSIRQTTTSVVGTSSAEFVVDGGVYVRTVTEKTETDELGMVDKLSLNVDYIHEWQTHFAEIWLKASDLESYAAASTNLSFNSEYFTVTGIEFGSAFDGTVGEIDQAAGTITGISGTANADISGDSYVLLARVALESAAGQGVAWADCASPIELEYALSDVSVMTAAGTEIDSYLGKSAVTDLWGNPLDVNDDGRITGADFSTFAMAYGQDTTTGEIAKLLFDYDRSGKVTGSDFSSFALYYGLTKEEVVSGAKAFTLSAACTQRYVGTELSADNTALVGKVLDAANQAWAEALGLTDTVDVTLVVKDFGTDELARAQIVELDSETGAPSRGIIYLDDDAAGNLWYSQLDTPTEGTDRYDLYTVLLHELGHLYGYDSGYAAFDAVYERFSDILNADAHSTDEANIMYESINPGERKDLTETDITIADAILSAAAEDSSLRTFILGSVSSIVTAEASVAAASEISTGLTTSVSTRLTDAEADAAALLIDAAARRELLAMGLEIENSSDLDLSEPILARDVIMEDIFVADEEDETDGLEFVEESLAEDSDDRSLSIDTVFEEDQQL